MLETRIRQRKESEDSDQEWIREEAERSMGPKEEEPARDDVSQL